MSKKADLPEDDEEENASFTKPKQVAKEKEPPKTEAPNPPTRELPDPPAGSAKGGSKEDRNK